MSVPSININNNMKDLLLNNKDIVLLIVFCEYYIVLSTLLDKL